MPLTDLSGLTDDAKPSLNLLSNPGFDYAQLYDPTVYTSLNDNDVGPDCWRVHFDAATMGAGKIKYKRIANAGAFSSANRGSFLNNGLGSPGKVMIYQTMESLLSLGLSGHKLTVQSYYRAVNSYTWHIALLAYNAVTPDVIALPPVATWNGAGVNPILNANWSYVAEFSFAMTPGDYFWVLTVFAPSSGYTNLAIATFSDDVIALGDQLDVVQTGIYEGFSGRGTWNPLAPDEDQNRVERFIEKTYEPDTIPGNTTTIDSLGMKQVGTTHVEGIRFRVRKPKAPVITFYNPNSGASGSWRDVDGAADATMTADDIGGAGFTARVTAGGTNTNLLKGHFVADASL